MMAVTLIQSIIIITFLCFICFSPQLIEGAPSCDNSSYDPPDDCTYGTTQDWCHRSVCAKGPGESCGGNYMINGECAEGTFCSCGKCVGCETISLKCYLGGGICLEV